MQKPSLDNCLHQTLFLNTVIGKICFSDGSVIKSPPANAGDTVLISGLEDPLEKEIATHSSTFAWKIPWTEQPAGCHPWSHKRVRPNLETKTTPPQWVPSFTLKSFQWYWEIDTTKCVLSCVRLPAHPWTVACQAPLSLEFYRQRHWSGLSFPSPGDLPNPGIKPTSFVSPALAGRFFTTSATWEAWEMYISM